MFRRIMAILVLVVMSSVVIAAQTTIVTFINNSPDTILGIVKFSVDENNQPVEYEVMNIRWNDKKKILELEPGLYGVTQYQPKQEVMIDGLMHYLPDKIVSYKSFYVKNKSIRIIF